MPVVLVNQMGATVYPVYARPGLFFTDDVSPSHQLAQNNLSLGENTAIYYLFFPFWLRQMDSDDEKNGICG